MQKVACGGSWATQLDFQEGSDYSTWKDYSALQDHPEVSGEIRKKGRGVGTGGAGEPRPPPLTGGPGPLENMKLLNS